MPEITIEKIRRARLEGVLPWDHLSSPTQIRRMADHVIGLLLAEVDRTQSAQDACFRKLTGTIAEVDRLKAARRIGELDNHHNALLCPYCNGPIKDEITRLQAENEQLQSRLHHQAYTDGGITWPTP